jgi:tetratricopeptide (TPR) repeat protein
MQKCSNSRCYYSIFLGKWYNLGRAYISKNDRITAESLLRMGLQRVTKEDFQLNYELHLNLGWVLLKHKQYQAAEKELRQAVAIDQAIEGKELGGGMAYCLLEDVLEKKKDIKEQLHWKNMCLTYARPETIDEYKWFIETGKLDTADRIDTTGVVNGESKPSTQP